MSPGSFRRRAFTQEAEAARTALAKGDLDIAFQHLERAHVLGQPWAGPHSWTHWMMLKIGWRRGDAREVRGQLLRLAAGGSLSLLGWLPVGNTGGANVPARQPMPLPEDLAALCAADPRGRAADDLNTPAMAAGLHVSENATQAVPAPATLPALTSVRFFLALGVVLFHLQLTWTWPTQDYTGLIERARLGVDVFFILSGFVLAYVYARQVEEGRYSHRRFLIARLARIYPAHLAVLVFMVAIALAALAMGETFDPARYSLLGLLQTALLIHAWTPTDTPIEWNGPSWSLSAEWGAYLLFPIFAWLGVKLRGRPLVLLVIAAGLFAGLDAAYRAVFGDLLTHAEFNVGVLRILPTFLAGVALHHLSARLSPTPRIAVLAALAATLVLIGLMHVSADERLVVAAAAGLVLALALVSKARADGPLAAPWLLFLGEASYAIYLFHLPMIVLWKNARAVLLGGDSAYAMPMAEAAALIGVIVVGGSLIHALLERPARIWIRRRFLDRPASLVASPSA